MAEVKRRNWFSRTFELQDPTTARLLPMEGLRGVAVTLVFLQHYSVQAELLGLASGPAAVFARAFHNYGNMGVELFFVLSGYLIYGTLVRNAPPFLAFMARRCQRIYPAFLVVFALAFAAMTLMPARSEIPDEFLPALSFVAANLVFLPGLFPIPAVVEVAWSLSYEMFFYLVTAVLVLTTGFHALARRSRVVVLALITAAFLALSHAGIPDFPARMLPFFAGMLLAEGLGGRVPAWLGLAAPVAAFVGYVTGAIPAPLLELSQTLAFFLLCAVCFRGAGVISRAMSWAPLRWLGNMSYSYYLLHGFVVHAAALVLGAILPGGMADWIFWLFMPVAFAATLAASAILFVGVEKPFSLKPRRAKPLERAPAGAV